MMLRDMIASIYRAQGQHSGIAPSLLLASQKQVDEWTAEAAELAINRTQVGPWSLERLAGVKILVADVDRPQMAWPA